MSRQSSSGNNLTPKKVVRKDGVTTTVHVREDVGSKQSGKDRKLTREALRPKKSDTTHSETSFCHTDEHGTKRWRNADGKLHREDGPAIEQANGFKEWYINGKRHREDGPAVEWPGGTRVWYKHGELHREDGPAIEYADGKGRWFKNGKLHRKDGPAVEHPDGTKEWWVNGKKHREDGPAIERPDGTKEWWVNGEELTEKQFRTYNLNVRVSNL